MSVQKFTAPDGTPMVMLPESEFEALSDAAAYDAAKAVAGPRENAIPDAVMGAILDQDGRRAIRQWRRLTQAQAAAALDVSQAYVSQWEARKRSFSLEQAQTLASLYRIDLELLA